MTWSPYQLTPFGVDVDVGRLIQARETFPDHESSYAGDNDSDHI
jgi:hypothetical protein